MKRVLVVFDSKYGATKFAAETIYNVLTKEGIVVDIQSIETKSITDYDFILIGSPIRFGRCTGRIKRFIKDNSAFLKNIQIAYFFTCMSIITTNQTELSSVFIDPQFYIPEKSRARMAFMESSHTIFYYLKHFLKILPNNTQSEIAFFKGRLRFSKLTMIHRLVMLFAMYSLPDIVEGDFINQTAIKSWVKKVTREHSTN